MKTKSIKNPKRQRFGSSNPRFYHGAATREKRFREYTIWSAMKTRCFNPNPVGYKNYGGRGIKVCKRWMNSFPTFLKDMGFSPEGTSLDRINNDGNYEPGNCRWATSKQQANNSRAIRTITFNGETKTLTEWANKIGMSKHALWGRIEKSKWPIDVCLTVPKFTRSSKSLPIPRISK